MADDVILETRNLTKRFPGVLANDRINLKIQAGEIHAIIGENGAGKSTLMKMLTGLYRPDEGRILYQGEPLRLRSARDAIHKGIGMVHQHFMLVDRFSVTENIILGAEGGRTINRARARQDVVQLTERYDFDLDPDARLDDLSVGQRQRVEILKVLYRGADLIILDEPTAVLVPQEIEDLFANLRRMKESGKTLLFISHKLDEVVSIADRISVLRSGRLVDTVDPDSVSKADLAERMVGRPVLFEVDKTEAEPGEIHLQLDHVSLQHDNGRSILSDVTLEVRQGEIYGIAGVEGNGQRELVECIMGLRQHDEGTILIGGQPVSGRTTEDIRLMGVAYIPEDRHQQGLALPMRIWENLILGHQRSTFSRGNRLDFKRIYPEAEAMVDEYDIRIRSLLSPVETLSGGNQQKVILAREMSRDPRLIVASQPTRGLDVGAIEFVRERLLRARDNGKAVLLVSADLDEIMALSDRIGVIYNGAIQREFSDNDVTAEKIGPYMVGTN